jgi:hypothetical protein
MKPMTNEELEAMLSSMREAGELDQHWSPVGMKRDTHGDG